MTRYQAQNPVPFRYDYVNQDGAAINISEASAIVLYLYLPSGTVKTVNGSYSATADQNRATATILATTITNDDLEKTTDVNAKSGIVEWQFLVTLSGQPKWSPRQQQEFFKNVDQYS